MFKPKSVAIIGASNKKGKIGNTVIKNMQDQRNQMTAAVHPHQAVAGHHAVTLQIQH